MMDEDTREFCIHYPNGGMGMNKVCKRGVTMKETVSDKDAPCWTDEVKTCQFAEYPTPEQIAEREKRLAEKLEGMGKFMQHKTDICFHCGKQVLSLRQVGRCVYGSCGCRMWQGRIPKEWQLAK
jgi:hypothetical protein